MHETLSLLFAFRPRIEALLINRRLRRDLQMLSERLEGGVDPLGSLIRAFAHAMNVRCAVVWKFGPLRTLRPSSAGLLIV